MSGGRGGFVPVSSSSRALPRNLVDAISEIQRYHVIERTGQDIPSDFLTVRGTLAFFGAGLRSGFLEGAMLALLLPLAWGVRDGAIPAFGGTAGVFGKCLVFFFALGISLVMTAVFCGMLPGYCGGNLARKAAGSLAWGRALALAAEGVLIFLLFSLLVSLLSPKNVFLFCEAARGLIGDPASLYSWIMAMKEPLRRSAAAQLALSPALGLVPFVALWFSGRRRLR